MGKATLGWLNFAVLVISSKDLLLRYGQSYADYRARTGMFFPKRQRGGAA